MSTLPLADVCGMLTKATDIEIRFDSDVDTATRITGPLKSGTLEEALDYIAALTGLRYRVIDSTTAVVGRLCAPNR